MRWLICLIMFYFIPDSAGNLCSPYHRARCCDPEVQWNKNWSINKTIASLHWLLQGGNARYRLRAIYKTDEGCPPSVYKCTRPRTGRNLVWTKEETDTFKGCVIFIIVKLRRGSGKDRQGMAPKVKGLSKVTLKLVATHPPPQVSLDLTNGQVLPRWGRWRSLWVTLGSL